MDQKCECPDVGNVPSWLANEYSEAEKPGMHHQPGECACTNMLGLYQRGDKQLTLCSCCHMPSDKLIRYL